MSAIFFYGLFMDRSLLEAQGLHPVTVGPAVLHDHRIHIGARATLLRAPGRRALGVVMELPDDEAGTLYADPSVRAYRPERVRVRLLDTRATVEADCYVLPEESGLAGTNPDYARRLARLVEALGLDPDYAREIAAFGKMP